MSGMVEIWVGEISKLREKVVTRNLKKASSSSSELPQQSQYSQHKKETIHTEFKETMSEATVCLLMDRFVPC